MTRGGAATPAGTAVGRLAATAAAVAVVLVLAPRPLAAAPATMNPIERVLGADERLAPVVENAARYRLQVVLGLIDDRQRLVQHAFRAEAEYFYPASSIKLCAAVAALEKLAELRASTGKPIDATTHLTYRPLFDDEVVEADDPSNSDSGRITAAHEIRKLFLVSDNIAYNRLYELAGPAAVNRSMHRAGLETARIVHRLSEARTPAENLRLPHVVLDGHDFRTRLPERTDRLDLPPIPVGGLSIGRGYLSGGELVAEPLDFSEKNRMSLADLQRGLCKVVRPAVDAGGPGFDLSDRQRALLMEPMRQYPRESRNPVYDPREYPDDYVKFLLPGLERVLPRKRLRIYNKVGQAYGFSVENAYVEDAETGRAFFLAAVLYTNSDGVLNDDEYEYDEVALPFLADLGEAVARALWAP